MKETKVIVEQRLKEIVDSNEFDFSIEYLKSIHKYLFANIFEFNGVFREYNITRKEKVLNNDTIIYTPFYLIDSTINYEFFQAKFLNVKNINDLINFNSSIWQIHPFCDGNTRTICTFMFQYLKNIGYIPNKDVFINNMDYYRNALVRANYINYNYKINQTNEFLQRYYQNLLFNSKNCLKNNELELVLKRN